MKLERIDNRMERIPLSQILRFHTPRVLSLAAALLPVVFLWGCLATVSDKNFSISGTIRPTVGGSGAMVSLSGVSSASTTSDGSGNYMFAGLSKGAYAVTPSKSGFAFSPTSQSATVNGANVSGVNFTAAAQQTHSVALSWSASTSTVAGYNVYRSSVSGSQYARLNSALISGLAFTDTGVRSGGTYYYMTTAIDLKGAESGPSNEVSVSIP